MTSHYSDLKTEHVFELSEHTDSTVFYGINNSGDMTQIDLPYAQKSG